jgi:hypothetical protein
MASQVTVEELCKVTAGPAITVVVGTINCIFVPEASAKER